MSVYITSIVIALINFPLVAILFTAPYATRQYRKFGACQVFRTLIVYSFVLYCMCAYFLVIFPLPEREVVAQMTSPYVQLIPFRFVIEFIRDSGFDITKPVTYLAALKTSYFIQPAFNGILLLPLGFFLRYYFKRNMKQTILIGFLVSLFFELSQLSGLFFIYPRPYRLFDIDDLSLNTLGAVLGYLITPIFRHLPSREELDLRSYHSGERVSIVRRGFAFGFDWIMIEIITTIVFLIPLFKPLQNYLNVITMYYIMIFLYFILQPLLTGGKTLGKRIVRIKITNMEGNTPNWIQYIIRYGLFYGLLASIPFWMLYIIISDQYNRILGIAVLFGGSFIGFIFMIRLFISLIRMITHKDDFYLYEKWSHTKNISTVIAPTMKKSKKTNEHEVKKER